MSAAEAGRVTMTLPPGEHMNNPGGTMHGGMMATLLDSVVGLRGALGGAARPWLHHARVEGELFACGDRSERADYCGRRGGSRRAAGGRRGGAGDGCSRAALRNRKHDLPGVRQASAMNVTLDRTALSTRTRMLLQAPVLPTLLRLAWPNMLVMLAQAATGLIEIWWVSWLGPGRAGRNGAGVPRRDADADGLGRGHGWRHLVRHCAGIGRGAQCGRRLAGAARAGDQRCSWPGVRRSGAGIWGHPCIARWAARALRCGRRWPIPTWCSPRACCSGR